jgi:hypothetical protein
VISHEAETSQPVSTKAWRPHRPWTRYLGSLALVALATLVSVPIQYFVSPINLVMIYLAAVVVAAVWLGRGPSVITAALSVLAFDFFFVPPHLTFAVSDTEYLITFASLFIVGIVISSLAVRAREQAEAAQTRTIQTTALYELSRDLAAVSDLEATMQVVIRHVGEVFGREAIILLPEGETVKPRAVSPDLTPSIYPQGALGFRGPSAPSLRAEVPSLHSPLPFATLRAGPFVTLRACPFVTLRAGSERSEGAGSERSEGAGSRPTDGCVRHPLGHRLVPGRFDQLAVVGRVVRHQGRRAGVEAVGQDARCMEQIQGDGAVDGRCARQMLQHPFLDRLQQRPGYLAVVNDLEHGEKPQVLTEGLVAARADQSRDGAYDFLVGESTGSFGHEQRDLGALQ